jgi:hypothetical protein
MNGSAASSLIAPVPSNRFKLKRHMKALLLLIPIATSGCTPAPQLDIAKQQIAAPWAWREDTLRVRIDRKRERVWVLSLDRVDVYDSRRRTLVRRILLPGWSVADSVGAPDIVLDRSGAAIISHNVEPRFWQIDGTSFILREHEIRLLGHENLAIGFSTLTLAPEGVIVAIDAFVGAPWRIDLRSGSAQKVPSRSSDGRVLSR